MPGKIFNIIFSFLASTLLLYALLTTINYLDGWVQDILLVPSAMLIQKTPILLLAATLEEILLRALLFAGLITYVSIKAYLVLIKSFLSLSHFPNVVLYFVNYFIGEIMYGYSFVKFQTILVPIGIGFSWNFVQGAVFGSPVSGVAFDVLFSMTIIPREVSSGGSLCPILLS